VEVRITPGAKRTLEHASALAGRSLSDFIVTSAYEEAKRTIEGHERMALHLRDQEVFVAALLDPPEPTPEARQAAARYRRTLRRE